MIEPNEIPLVHVQYTTLPVYKREIDTYFSTVMM